ncbi:MAG: cell division protein FtsA [Nitrospirae bacterium]|nr:cell division protein FtsA [Nitrospirota bacterium]
MKGDNLIVGLDVGTTKICAIVGEVRTGALDIIGLGSAPSKGLRKGVVVNIESTVESIRKAIREAEIMSGIEIKAVYVGIAGGHINSFPSHGVIAVKEKEISQRDIDRVVDAAKAVAIPLDREVLHVIPMDFIVDGQDGIKDPRGMSGVRLEAKVHIVTGAVASVQNLVKCCEKAGLDVIDIVLEPLASGEATLSQDEKDLGVGIVDVGGGTTDIALFHGGSICHTSVLTLGGSHFTNDIAVGLRTPTPEAERIKKKYGCAILTMVNPEEEIDVVYAGDRPHRKIPRRYLVEILQLRAEELFELVKEEIRKGSSSNVIASGIVLTGGAALMDGMDSLAENILELPVRVGNPVGIGGLKDIVSSPMYATGVGLVLYGAKDIGAEQGFKEGGLFQGILNRMKDWVDGIFK